MVIMTLTRKQGMNSHFMRADPKGVQACLPACTEGTQAEICSKRWGGRAWNDPEREMLVNEARYTG